MKKIILQVLATEQEKMILKALAEKERRSLSSYIMMQLTSKNLFAEATSAPQTTKTTTKSLSGWKKSPGAACMPTAFIEMGYSHGGVCETSPCDICGIGGDYRTKTYLYKNEEEHKLYTYCENCTPIK
jgi:hypothetical protein